MFKVNKKYTRTVPLRRSGVFIVNFEHISHLFLVLILLNLSRKIQAGCCIWCFTFILWFNNALKKLWVLSSMKLKILWFSVGNMCSFLVIRADFKVTCFPESVNKHDFAVNNRNFCFKLKHLNWDCLQDISEGQRCLWFGQQEKKVRQII